MREFMYVKWKGGKRTVVNDIFSYIIKEGFYIMDNDSIDLSWNPQNKTKLDQDEMICGITTGWEIYYTFVRDIISPYSSRNDLQPLEKQIKALLIKTGATNIIIDYCPFAPC